MPKKRRVVRGKSPHPGVVLIPRRHESGAVAWRARWRDPFTNRTRWETLEALGLTSDPARRDWAARKSRTLAVERAALASGAVPVERLPVAEAIERYFDGAGSRLRERTRKTYQTAADRLVAWCGDAGVRLVSDLTPARLAAFREHLARLPRVAVSAKGTRRGSKTTSGERRSPFSINRDTASIKAILNTWRRAGWLRLTRDDMADRLGAERTARPRPRVYDSATLRAIFAGILAHDAEAFAETRAEHAGDGTPGSTPKHRPLAPLALFVLLTGCRAGEALSLTWDDVNLDAHDGAGEVVIRASKSKTHHERAVRLNVSPSLRRLLAALKLRSDGPAVFGGAVAWTEDDLKGARRRVMARKDVPAFTFAAFRSTCSTVLACAPGIFDAASAFMSAKRAGHSVAVAEKHYAGVLTIPSTARTLEAALNLEDVAESVVERASSGARSRKAVGA